MIKKAFVTGADGFLGRHIVEDLFKDGYEITCLVNSNKNKVKYLDTLKIKYYSIDIRDVDNIIDIIPQNAFVFHCAAITQSKKESKNVYLDINAKATLDLYRSSISKNVSQFIFISSNQAKLDECDKLSVDDIAYSYSHYGYSKNRAEKMLFEEFSKINVPLIIMRPSGFYGPHMNFNISFGKIFNQIKNGLIFTIKNPKALHQFSYVKNITHAIMLAHKKVSNGIKIYNISDTPSMDYHSIIMKINKNINTKARIIAIPVFIAKLVAFIGDKIQLILNKKLPINSKLLNKFFQTQEDDISKTVKDLNYKPIYTIDQGIEETIYWLNSSSKS